MNLKVGDRVRVTKSPEPSDLPNGTEGTVKEVVELIPGAFFFEAEGIDNPLLNGKDGFPLFDVEVEKVSA